MYHVTPVLLKWNIGKLIPLQGAKSSSKSVNHVNKAGNIALSSQSPITSLNLTTLLCFWTIVLFVKFDTNTNNCYSNLFIQTVTFCTHYQFLRKIYNAMGEESKLISTARCLSSLLEEAVLIQLSECQTFKSTIIQTSVS